MGKELLPLRTIHDSNYYNICTICSTRRFYPDFTFLRYAHFISFPLTHILLPSFVNAFINIQFIDSYLFPWFSRIVLPCFSRVKSLLFSLLLKLASDYSRFTNSGRKSNWSLTSFPSIRIIKNDEYAHSLALTNLLHSTAGKFIAIDEKWDNSSSRYPRISSSTCCI